MPCKNGETHLTCQLDALVAQETSFPWEVIFVDNGSTDRSVQIAETYKDRLQLNIISAPEESNQAYARNVGARAARAQKLVFIDADDEVAPGFLASMFAALQDHDFVTSPRDEEALNPEWTRHAHAVPKSAWNLFSPFAFGSAIGLSSKALQTVGGCPEKYDPAWDIALSYRLQQAGFVLAFLPEALYRYRHRTSVRGLYRQTRLWGCYEALVYRDFGTPFVRRRPLSTALSEWFLLMRALIAARSKADLAQCAVRCGYSVGRVHGSVQYRVFYL